MMRVLREAVPPRDVEAVPPGPWPRVRRQLDRSRPSLSIPEWVALVAAAAWCMARPEALRVLLFHF